MNLALHKWIQIQGLDNGGWGTYGNVCIPSLDDSHAVSYMAKSEDTGKDKVLGALWWCTILIYIYIDGIYSIESLHLLRIAQNIMILIDL